MEFDDVSNRNNLTFSRVLELKCRQNKGSWKLKYHFHETICKILK